MPQHHLVIPQTVQVTHRIAHFNLGCSIVTHYTIPDGTVVDVNLANAIDSSIKALWAAHLASFCPTTTAFNQTDLRDLRSANMALVSSSNPPSAGTSATDDHLPPGVAAALTVRTARAGRQFRGRMYWCAFGESANDANGNMSAAFKTALDAFAAGYVTASTVSGCHLGVSHRPTTFDPITGLPVAPDLGFTTPAVSVVARDAIWDSQRRRAQ